MDNQYSFSHKPFLFFGCAAIEKRKISRFKISADFQQIRQFGNYADFTF